MVWGLWAAVAGASVATSVDVGRGPVEVRLPDPAIPGEQLPVVLMLHGYTSNSVAQEAYFQYGPLVDTERFIYVAPDGLADVFGLQNWNATDYCCDWTQSTNDVGYLTDVLDAVEAIADVDLQRVYIVGHSNGGFMAHRMACEDPGRFAGIVSLAGVTFDDPLDCNNTEPVHVLQIHGTADTTIRFGGDCVGGSCYPSAPATVAQWESLNGCSAANRTPGPSRDLDAFVAGDETSTLMNEACDPGGSTWLWRMSGSGHLPALTADFAPSTLQWMWAHPKP